MGVGSLVELMIEEFAGLNRQMPPNHLAKEFSPAALNVDHSRASLRPRHSIANTSYIDNPAAHVADPVRIKIILHRKDGSLDMIWVQGDDFFRSASPKILATSAASGAQLDGALSAVTYPQKFRGPATVYHAVELDGVIYLVNGQEAPLRWSPEAGLTRWSIYQPRSLGYGLPGLGAPGNFAYQAGTGATVPLAYGPLVYAFTWYNAKLDDESNPSPIFDYATATTISPYPLNGKVGRIDMEVDRPADPQVTHARFYRALSGGTANDLRRMGQVAIPAAGKVRFFADITMSGHLGRYGDSALLNAPPLETDHGHVPPLGILFQHKNYLMGAMTWQESFLPGRTWPGGNATCSTTTAFGYVVTIAPGATPFRVHEAMAGNMTIRFPAGANRPYQIMDVNEANQTLLIGMLIGAPFTTLPSHFDALDAADENLPGGSAFILEASRARLRWSKRNLPSYWPGYNSRPIGKNDGEDLTAGWVTNDQPILAKPNRLYSLPFESNPAPGDGRVRQLSGHVGCPQAHAHADGDGFSEFAHTTGIYRTDGGPPIRISEPLGYGAMTPSFSVHYRAIRAMLHFAVQSGDSLGGCFVHYYEQRKWSRWEWAGRTFVAGLSAVDADGVERVFLGTSTGFHYGLHDSIDGVGIADGLASTQNSTFFARSRCTAAAAVGTLVDASNSFPNHTAVGASLIGDPIRVIAGTGAGQVGTIVARVDANTLTVSGFTVPLDDTSEYEIGYITWYWRTPWLRVGQQAYTQQAILPFYRPKAYDPLGDRFRHDKRLEVRVVEGFPASSTVAFDFKEVRRGADFSLDPVTRIPLVQADPQNDCFLVDYTNSTYPTTSPVTVGRGKPNPGHVSVPFHAVSSFIQTQIGETGTRIKGEVVALGLAVAPMEGQQ